MAETRSKTAESDIAIEPLSLGDDRRGAQRATPYERLRTAILEGTLTPGSPLVEVQVAKACGVSRTPVREAFTRLEQDDLIERSDRGLVVKQRSPEEILDIYEVRISLEELTARYAALRHTALDRMRLEKVLTMAESVPAERYAAHNREFHRLVWSAGHNRPLIGLLDRLSSHLTRYPATTLTYPGRWEEATAEHRELVEAIVARDADAAGAIATAHFTRAREIRLELYENEIV